jgi:hypothetical protein
MAADFWENLDRLAEAVRRHPLLELQSYTAMPPAAPALIRQPEEEFGHPLPRALADLYPEHNSVEFQWCFKRDIDPPLRQQVLDAFAPFISTPEYMFDIAGAVNIVPVERFLLVKDYRVPQVKTSDPESPDHQFTFDGGNYSRNEFNAMLHVFDAAWEDGAMAFLTQPGRADWKMLWLTDNRIFFESSRTTSLDDCLRLVIATWGLITAREAVFHQYGGYREEPVVFDEQLAARLVPRILSAA